LFAFLSLCYVVAAPAGANLQFVPCPSEANIILLLQSKTWVTDPRQRSVFFSLPQAGFSPKKSAKKMQISGLQNGVFGAKKMPSQEEAKKLS